MGKYTMGEGEMVKMRFAEDANYWDTTVHPAKSQAEIIEMLESFGSSNLMITQGQADGKMAWLVRFEWLGSVYRFTFVPLECRNPDKESSFGGTRRRHADQARYQMGRIAVHFTKAILTAAEAHPHALFGFVELPGVDRYSSGLPMTAGEIGIEGLVGTLPPVERSLLNPGKVGSE